MPFYMYLRQALFIVLFSIYCVGASALPRSEKSSAVAFALETPAATAKPSLVGAISISWQPVGGATAYEVERSLTGNPGTFSPLQTVQAPATRYRHTGLFHNQKVYYRVRAISASQNSPYSATVSATTHAQSHTYTIMPLGDSNTEGGAGNYSTTQKAAYRDKLEEWLQQKSIRFDFVGSEQSGSELVQDVDHAGFGGARNSDLVTILKQGYYFRWYDNVRFGLDKEANYLATFSPDIILLHSGTNDISNDGVDNSQKTVEDLANILNEVDKYEQSTNKEVLVIVAKIIKTVCTATDCYRGPDNTKNDIIDRYNAKIETLVSSRIQNGDMLRLVDMADAGIVYQFTDNGGDMADRLHPAQKGYDKMAPVWYKALDGFLNITPQAPDTQAPDSRITSKPSAFSNSSTATFGFESDESNVTYQVSMDGGAYVAATNPYAVNGLADGEHTLQVRAMDASGNIDPSPASYTWVVDTKAPAPPVVIAPDNGAFLATDKPTFSGTSEAGSTVAVTVDAAVIGTVLAATDGKWTFTPASGLADGKHNVSAKATDAAGNVSQASNNNTFQVDATTPDTKIVSAPALMSNSKSAAFTLESNRQDVTFEASLDGAPYTTVSNPLNLSNLSEGSHTLQVRAKNQAGTVDPTPASHTWTVDTQPPAAPVVSKPTEGQLLNTNKPTFSGTAEAGSTVMLMIDGKQAGTVAAASDGSWSLVPTSALPEGAQQATVQAADAAGNTSNVSNLRFTIDTIAPETQIAEAPVAHSNSPEAKFRFSSNETNVMFWVSLDGAAYAQVANPYTVSGLAEGAHTLNVRAVDAAGNTDASPATHRWDVDTKAPEAPLFVSITEDRGPFNNDQVTADNTLLLLGKAEANAAVSISENGKALGTTMVNAQGNWTFNYEATALQQGTHQFKATATDAAGNTSTGSLDFTVTIDLTAPEISLTNTAGFPVNGPFTLDIKFSEDVYGLTANDFSVVNATFSNLQATDKSTYKATISPAADGKVQVQLPAGKVMDLAGNLSRASNQLEAEYDATRPRLTLSTNAPEFVKAPFEVKFTFSEGVTGFDAADIQLTNADVSNFSMLTESVYTAYISPKNDGMVRVQVAMDKAFDQAKNGNMASNILEKKYDVQRPTLTLTTTAPDPTNAPYTVTLRFSEVVQAFAPADLSLTNATVSQFKKVDDQTYTFLITPKAAGEVTVSLAENAVKDLAANGNEASAVLARLYDADRPAITLTTASPALTNVPFSVSFSLSEPVSGFEVADITAGNAVAENFRKVSDLEYKVTIRPAKDGKVTVAVAADKMLDAALNGNTASNSLEITYDATGPAGYAVAFGVEKVDITNQDKVSVQVSSAELNATYAYRIRSSNGGEEITGTARVETTTFTITNLNLTPLPDGMLTVSLYLTDAAGNKGSEVTAQVKKLTRNVEAVQELTLIKVPFKTPFESLPLPKKVRVTYANGEVELLDVDWQKGAYNNSAPGTYSLQGVLQLKENSSNIHQKTAAILVEVAPNQPPTALMLSKNTFRPDIASHEGIGTFTTTDPDDDQFEYTLVAGEGDTHNELFEISNGNELRLISNQGLSGISTFTIRARSTDPFQNSIEQTFTLTKTLYQPTDKLKLVNAFSPDGDGINDTWTVPELRYYNDIEVTVFDRAGVRVFHTRNPEEGWDGRAKGGRILPGSYFYIIQIKDIAMVQKGVVTVLN
ncbi:Ig-like domain-containing protein [Pontibacter sp. CAU 1760]